MSIELSRDGAVATVTLNRPEKLNALTDDMYNRLTELFTGLQADESVRAVVVTGAGRAFCSGSDVTTMGKTDLLSGRARMQIRHRMILALSALEKPVIASVRGATVGIGFSIMMACDLAVASDTAKFSQIFKRIGLVPDGGSIFFLAQRLGLARAKELVYTARMLLAQDAMDWGLVNRVVPDAELEAATRALALEMAESATHALALSKKMFQSMYMPALEALLETENLCQTVAKLTDDHKEGVTAFRDKRPARFTGR